MSKYKLKNFLGPKILRYFQRDSREKIRYLYN